MDRATPFNPPAKYGIAATALADKTATESEGVTKNLRPDTHKHAYATHTHIHIHIHINIHIYTHSSILNTIMKRLAGVFKNVCCR